MTRPMIPATALLVALLLSVFTATSGIARAQDDTVTEDPSDSPSDDASEPDDSPSDDASEPDESPSDDASEPDDSPTDDASEPDDSPSDGPTDGPTASPTASPTEDAAVAVVAGARVHGPDRMSTAVAISHYEFPGGAEEVYLARADAFADAVAAGSLRRGPVLLVPQCGELPVVVAGEVRRLRPTRVVALGGPAAICDAILQQAMQAAQAGHASGDDSTDDGTGSGGDDIGDDEPRTESTSYLDLAVGEEASVHAADAGTATIRRTDAGVELVSASPASGWAIRPGEADEPGQAEVSFTDGDTRVDLDAQLEGSQVRVRVRTQAE